MSSDAIVLLAVKHCDVLVSHYIRHVCASEVRELIDAHPFYANRLHTVCFLTAAALVWLLTGEDLAAPFSGVWENPSGSNKGRNRVVAFGRGGSVFEDTLEHVLIVFDDDRCVVDSHFMRGQPAMVHGGVSRLEEFAWMESRVVYFDEAPGVQVRLASVLEVKLNFKAWFNVNSKPYYGPTKRDLSGNDNIDAIKP